MCIFWMMERRFPIQVVDDYDINDVNPMLCDEVEDLKQYTRMLEASNQALEEELEASNRERDVLRKKLKLANAKVRTESICTSYSFHQFIVLAIFR